MVQAEKTIVGPPPRHAFFLLLITSLVYAQSLMFSFFPFDDKTYIVDNPQLRRWGSVSTLFFPAAEVAGAGHNRIAGFYRPLQGSWLLLNFKVLGLRPVLWHLVALSSYGLGVWLLWRLIWRLTRDSFVALAGALLFALHPMHVEGVAWLSGAYVEGVVSALFFAGFLAYLRWRESERPSYLTVCGLLTFAALLCKETAAALPVLIVAHLLVFSPRDARGKMQVKSMVQLTATMLLAVAIYAALRFSAIGALVTISPHRSWTEVFLLAPVTFATYLKHALWPFHLGTWYDNPAVSAMSATQFYLPLSILLGYLACNVWALVRKPLLGFLMLWWLIPLGPSWVGIRALIPWEWLHDRYAFIPLAGLCVIAASILGRAPATKITLFGFKAASVIALAGLTVLLGVLTALQVGTWIDDKAMFVQAVRACPTCPRPRLLLANWFATRGDFEHALALDRETIQISPDRWEPLFAYGWTLAAAGDRQSGVNVLTRASLLAPREAEIYVGLADVLSRAGKYDEAILVLQRGIQLADRPDVLREYLRGTQGLRNRYGEH